MNIHLDRYKQQIVESTRFPGKLPHEVGPEDEEPIFTDEMDDARDRQQLGQKPDVVGVCETLVDEIGDKTLQKLHTLINESTYSDLIEFCMTLKEYTESQLAYRNQSTEMYNDFQNQRQ